MALSLLEAVGICSRLYRMRTNREEGSEETSQEFGQEEDLYHFSFNSARKVENSTLVKCLIKSLILLYGNSICSTLQMLITRWV